MRLNSIDTSVDRRPIQLHYEVKEIKYADRNTGQTNHFIPLFMEERFSNLGRPDTVSMKCSISLYNKHPFTDKNKEYNIKIKV